LQLSASDNDSDKKIEYRLLSVSNNGIRKFAVESGSGRVNVVGPVRAGEHYSLTVAALDSGGKATQAVMEVREQVRQ
jgi:Tfp pilus tip-associated adhesin PilY1